MFKKCMKRYFIGLRHIPGVLGVLFIALLIGGSVFLSGSSSAVSTMTDNISEITGQADLSVTRIGDAIRNSLTDALSFDDPEGAGEMLSTDGAANVINQSIEDALNETVDNYAEYITDVAGEVASAVATIFLFALIYLVIQIISWVLGKWYVLLFEKSYFRKMGQHTLKGWFLHNGLILLTYILLIIAFCIDIAAGVVFVCLYPIIYCIVSLISSDLAFDKNNRLPMKKTLHIKNILVLLGTNLLQLLLTLILVLIVASAANWIIALYLGIALAIIASAVVTINSDEIVLQLIEGEKAVTPEIAAPEIATADTATAEIATPEIATADTAAAETVAAVSNK